jgi:hypothetical protein
MRRITTTLSTVAVVLMTAGLLAQANPNFAGKWTRDMTASPMPDPAAGGGRGGGRGFGGGGLGNDLNITQDAKTLTIEYTAGGQTPAPVKLVYNLDGSESKNTITTGRGAQEQSAKAAWQSGKLVITTTTNFNGNAVESTRTLSMEGGNLVVEQSGRQGGAGTKVVYKKS